MLSPAKDPLSHFQILAPELVFQICSYLDNQDLSSLLPTCKYIHNAASGYLRDEASRTTLHALSEAISRGDLSGIEALVKSLDALLRGKSKHKSVNVALKVDTASVTSYGNRDLLLALKAFSHTRPASEFSISTLTAELCPAKITQFFDVRKLVKLNISFNVNPWSRIPKSSAGILDIESAEYINATAEERELLRANAYREYEKPLPELIADITSLNRLFVRAQSLEHLQLTPIMNHYKKFRPLKTLPPELEEFKETFLNLKRLRSLELNDFLFHLSFFLPVPENVKRLSLKNIQYYSKAWWMEFAKYKFTNLEELQLDYDPIFCHYSMYESDTNLLHTDGVLKTPDEIENGFKLGNVELNSLERFIHERTHNHLFSKRFCFPTDLVPCIVRRNKRLEQKAKQALANRYAEETIQRCRERLEKAMESYRDVVKGELVGAFLEGSQRYDDFEKCFSSYAHYVLGKPEPAC